MCYEILYITCISSLDRLDVVLVRYGIWGSYVQYGLEVQYFLYRYFDMMSYDNSILNIIIEHFPY